MSRWREDGKKLSVLMLATQKAVREESTCPHGIFYRRLEVDLNTGALGAGTARPLLFATGFAAALGVLARFQVAHLDVLALFFLSHLIFLSLVVDWVGRGL